MKGKIKTFTILLCLVLISIFLVPALSNISFSGDTIIVEFATEALTIDTATYNVGDTEVTLTVTGGSIENGRLSFDRDNLNNISFTLGNTYDSDTMQVMVRGLDNYQNPLYVENNTASLSGLNFPGTVINISVESIDQEPIDEGIEVTYMDFTINGKNCTIDSEHQVINVDDDTNFDSLEDYFMKRIGE